MSRRVIGVILIVMVFTLIIPTACAGPKFELSSLEITPDTVAVGDTATVSVDLANTGSAEGTYNVTLSVDGVVLETQTVTIPEKSSRKVTFDVIKETVGVYSLEIGNLSGELHVVRPAEFRLSSLVVTPEEVHPGDEVTVTADVYNAGGLEGTYVCTLLVGTKVQEEKEVTLDSEETTTVVFMFKPTYNGGRCVIEVGDLTETIQTLRPTDIKVESVLIAPTVIEVGASIAVVVTVHNWGDVEGSYKVTLEIDGDSADTKSVAVGGQDTVTTQFTVTDDIIGLHEIKIDGTKKWFTVVPKAPPGYVGFTYGILPKIFFIAYPEGWQRQEVEYPCLLMVLGPLQSDDSLPGFNIAVENLPQEVTAMEYFEVSRQIYRTIERYKGVSTEELTINGVAAVKHTFTAFSDGRDCTGIQVFLIYDEKAYTITLITTTVNFNKLVGTFNNIISSFQFLP